MQSYGHHSPSLGKMETSRAQYGARGPRFNRSNLFGDIFVVISLSLCMVGPKFTMVATLRAASSRLCGRRPRGFAGGVLAALWATSSPRRRLTADRTSARHLAAAAATLC
jgi:hypothetical protein